MKGNNCGFLHQFDKQRMPTCRFYAKYNECKEPDCPFKHSLDDVKDCNMFKLGFCIHGPNCRYRHAPSAGPPPSIAEAALIGRPGHLHGAPTHLQRYQMALAKQQSEGGGPGGAGGPGGGAPPPLPPGPPPSSVRMVQQPMALPDAPGAGVDGDGGGDGTGAPTPAGGGETGSGDFGGGGALGSYQAPPLAGGMPGMPGAAGDGEEDYSIPLG